MIDPLGHLLFILVVWTVAALLRILPPHYLLTLGGALFAYALAPFSFLLILAVCVQAVILVLVLVRLDRASRWRKYGPYLLLPNLFWVDLRQLLFDYPVIVFALSFSVIRIFMTAKQLIAARKPSPVGDLYWVFCAGFYLTALTIGPVFSGLLIRDQHRKAQPYIPVLRDYRLVLTGLTLALLVAPALFKFRTGLDPHGEFYRLITIPVLFLNLFAAFWGQSLIAEHTSRFFGYRLPVNFRHPWKARNIREFWSRWHRSMADFVMRYLFLPLTLNKVSPERAAVVAFVFMGLWHNLSPGYLIWGLGHGLLLGLWPKEGFEPAWLRPLGPVITWGSVITLSWLANYGGL